MRHETANEKHGSPMSRRPDEALELLREGNDRFAVGTPLNRFTARERSRSVEGQQPFAIVVGCSDARVPVETVFDVGVGELFVVRTAGHVLAEAGIASVRFAAEELGCRLIVVLGHQDCGAVTAALAGHAPSWLEPIVSHIDVEFLDESLAPHDAPNRRLAAAVDRHVQDTVSILRSLARAFDIDEPVKVVGGSYRLASGEVHWIDDAGLT